MLELAAQYKALAEFMKVEFFDAGSVFRPTPWTGFISPPRTMRIWELLSPERLWRYLPHTTPRASRLLLEDPANCQEPGFKDRPRLSLRPRAHSGIPHGTSPPPWTVSRCNHDRTAASVRKRRVFQLLHEGWFAGKGITAAIQISIISECRYRWLHVLDSLSILQFDPMYGPADACA